jgi:hypothetical protein
MDLNYYDTLIAVADDCRATNGMIPQPRGGKPTVAMLQYEMLIDRPFRYTQEDVLFESWFARQGLPPDARAEARGEYFSRPQACLRSSPLAKQYGWGFLFNSEGRVALLPMESEEYRRLASRAEPRVQVLKALRSKRA